MAGICVCASFTCPWELQNGQWGLMACSAAAGSAVCVPFSPWGSGQLMLEFGWVCKTLTPCPCIKCHEQSPSLLFYPFFPQTGCSAELWHPKGYADSVASMIQVGFSLVPFLCVVPVHHAYPGPWLSSGCTVLHASLNSFPAFWALPRREVLGPNGGGKVSTQLGACPILGCPSPWLEPPSSSVFGGFSTRLGSSRW